MRLMTKKELKQDLKEVNKRKKFREALLQLVKNRSMNKPEIKTVYVPVNGSSTLFVVEEGRISDSVEEQQLITFTPEEYNKHIQGVIDDALNTAAEEANLESRLYTKFQSKIEKTENLGQETNLEEQLYLGIEEKSIINTSQQTFEKWKI